MDYALQLYGTLILTVLGFILPILTILLALSPEGVKALKAKLENEKKQSEENIANEMKKKESAKEIDIKALTSALRDIKKKKNLAEKKLSYLKPISLLIKIAWPFVVALLGVIIVFQIQENVSQWIPNAVLAIELLSVLSFFYGVYILWSSLEVLVEVTEVVNQEKNKTNEKIIELLSILVENTGKDNIFLKPSLITGHVNGSTIKKNSVLEFSTSKHEIPVSIVNAAETMAKKVEFGLIFPKDFLVESTNNLKIITQEKDQIIRFNEEIIHANENRLQGKMTVTFLKPGEFTVTAFIKGENIKLERFNFKIKVIA